ncbi:Uncharacterised protein [Sphingobacterium mizutaii]|uniref:Uncharacterized protein n=1 Tax=Sphingobacterium mizutaii TaxID=1010 RepID=A0AAJ5BYI7_9SPHI|nr:hypothetical protein [Sphingobacterium mizutaii]SDL62434.1 hypothetical protein SAMN05192578_105236 [Sphingobacterium mizutaii]SNV35682.1 Uncharacterised protein [Sphingobacterium mizutaii]
MELQIKIIGYLLMVLACVHVIFPKYFGWKEDLAPLQQINRSMMKVHTFFIALTVFLMGLLCVTSTQDLLQTELGRKLCLGLGVFWLIRLFFQFFIYPSILWKGKKLETIIHIVAIVFWIFLSYSFLWGYFSQRS